jgi:hypothetical protein
VSSHPEPITTACGWSAAKVAEVVVMPETPTCRACGGALSASGTHCLVCGEPVHQTGAERSSDPVTDAEQRFRDAVLPGGAPGADSEYGLVSLLLAFAR